MTIRPFRPADHDAVMALAGELVAGRRPWRDEQRWLAMTQGWVAESLDAADSPQHAVVVALDQDEEVAGFIALSTRTHFTGDVDAYVGELVVSPRHRREGFGRALLEVAETWAREHGFRTLTLDTGGANRAARELYAAAGFVEEDVRLTKLLG